MQTIKTFDNAIDAHLMKTKLESEGIFCYLADEHIIGINPLMSVALGGIKLNVAQEHVEQALKILQESAESPLSDEFNRILICPTCGSTQLLNNISHPKGFLAKIATVFSFLTATMPIYTQKSYLCKDCNTIFEKSFDDDETTKAIHHP